MKWLDQELLNVVMLKNLDNLSKLLDGGANANAIDIMGYSALSLAILSKHDCREKVAMLLAHGADPSSMANPRNNYTVLMLALEKRKFDIATLLLKKGADVYIEDYDGWTALDYIIREHAPKVLWDLIPGDAKSGSRFASPKSGSDGFVAFPVTQEGRRGR